LQKEGAGKMSWIAWAIVASEVAFWVFILLALATRYVWRRRRLSMVLFAMTPVIDFLLLVLTAVDLSRGATATWAHGLSAVYIGVSLAFGKNMIEWADNVFRRRVLKEHVPKAVRFGRDHAVHYAKGFGRHVLAFLIGGALVGATVWWVGDPSRTAGMLGIMARWAVVLGIDFLITVSYFVWPKKPRADGQFSG
jgi:hypothetical protein